MRLLVVDWDFFFPTRYFDPQEWGLWDWSHSESWPQEFQETALWPGRAVGFIRNGLDLPGTSGEEREFWQRFRFRRRCDLFYADSNKEAASERVYRGVDEVWLFDAHHDSGYNGRTVEQALADETVTCEDWMFVYDVMGADLHMRYPRWKDPKQDSPMSLDSVDVETDDGAPVPGMFDRVFVCRSGSWTPPWIEDAFWDFIAAAPVQRRVLLDDMTRRQHDAEQVQREREIVDTMLRQLKESTS